MLTTRTFTVMVSLVLAFLFITPALASAEYVMTAIMIGDEEVISHPIDPRLLTEESLDEMSEQDFTQLFSEEILKIREDHRVYESVCESVQPTEPATIQACQELNNMIIEALGTLEWAEHYYTVERKIKIQRSEATPIEVTIPADGGAVVFMVSVEEPVEPDEMVIEDDTEPEPELDPEYYDDRGLPIISSTFEVDGKTYVNVGTATYDVTQVPDFPERDDFIAQCGGGNDALWHTTETQAVAEFYTMMSLAGHNDTGLQGRAETLLDQSELIRVKLIEADGAEFADNERALIAAQLLLYTTVSYIRQTYHSDTVGSAASLTQVQTTDNCEELYDFALYTASTSVVLTLTVSHLRNMAADATIAYDPSRQSQADALRNFRIWAGDKSNTILFQRRYPEPSS